MTGEWWQRPGLIAPLEQALAHVNAANEESLRDEVERCRRLLDGLDRCLAAFRAAAGGREAGEAAALRRLLADGIARDRGAWLCGRPSVARLAGVEPLIADRGTLPRSPDDRPDPRAGLEGLAGPLHGLRATVAHGKTPPPGPDPGRGARGRRLASAAIPVLRDVFEALFDFPSTRLAVYGTLAPGQANHRVIAGIPGAWTSGHVEGIVTTVAGYPAFEWVKGAGTVPVRLLASAGLPRHWPRIDAFEGRFYRRVLVPVRAAGAVTVAQIYARRARGGPRRPAGA